MTYYVWGGSLKGVAVDADNPREAVVAAVLSQEACLLHRTVRVSIVPRGPDPTDTYFTLETAEDVHRQFPELIDHPDLQTEFLAVSSR